MKFEIKHIFECRPTTLYNAWLDSNKHSEMTGGEAKIESIINSHFTNWDNYISGEILELKPNEYIKMKWRTTEFLSKQEDSIVEIKFVTIQNNKTELTLIHSNLLENDFHYKQGWIDHYFSPMELYF